VHVEVVTQRTAEALLTHQLSAMLSESQGAQLSSGKLNRKTAQWKFTAEVITPQAFSPAVVATYEEGLLKQIKRPLHLILRSLITKDIDRNGQVFMSEDERSGLSTKQAEAELLQQASSLISHETQDLPGALLTDLRRDKADRGLAFTATVQAPSAIAPPTVAEIQHLLEQRLDQPVKLIVRTLQTRDADSDRYIYAEEAIVRQPTADEIAMQLALASSISSQLAELVSGSSLLELRYQVSAGRLVVNAAVQAPRAVTPGEVRQLQLGVRAEVSDTIDLTVRTSVQATATAEGYLNDQQTPPG
jgi:hypothetical protein